MSENSVVRTADALADAVSRLYPVPEPCAEPMAAYLAARRAQVRKGPVDTSPPVEELILRDGTLYTVTANQVARWSKVYPDVLVMDTLREMATFSRAERI